MNKEKIIIITILAFSFFAIFGSDYWNDNIGATIWSNGEKDFSEPIDVVWRGEVISTMAGGACVGLKGEFDKYDLAMACLSDINSSELWKIEGTVTITGKWLGITCAYKNTIFGECVPEVVVEKVEK